MNERFKYKQVKEGEAVYLDGKRVGTIKAVYAGFAYFPKGSKQHGEHFQHMFQVKQSIEAE